MKIMKFIIALTSLILLIGTLFISAYTGSDFQSIGEKFTNIFFIKNIIELIKGKEWIMLFIYTPVFLAYLVPALMLLIIFFKSLIGIVGRPRKLRLFGLCFTLLLFISIFYGIKYGVPKIVDKMPAALPDNIKLFMTAQTMFSVFDIHIYIYVITGYGVLAIILAFIGNLKVKPKKAYQTINPQVPQTYYPQVFPSVTVCKTCGTQMPDNSQYCAKCGTKLK